MKMDHNRKCRLIDPDVCIQSLMQWKLLFVTVKFLTTPGLNYFWFLFLTVLGENFMKYLEAFKPYLSSGLQNFEDHQVNFFLPWNQHTGGFYVFSNRGFYSSSSFLFVCHCGNYWLAVSRLGLRVVLKSEGRESWISMHMMKMDHYRKCRLIDPDVCIPISDAV